MDVKIVIITLYYISSCNNFNAWQYPCFPLLFDTNSTRCSPNGRSIPVCTRKAYIEPRQQENHLSAFIDASQIYSNEFEKFEALRSHAGKKEVFSIKISNLHSNIIRLKGLFFHLSTRALM